jgi:hypothetical protein
MPTDPNQPGSTDDYNSWLWEQGIKYILDEAQGTDGTVPDRSKVANPEMRWLKFLSSQTVSANSHPTVTPKDYQLVVYAPVGGPTSTTHQGNQGTSGSPSTYSSVDQSYLIVTAEASFWMGQKDGKSPMDQWNILHAYLNGADLQLQAIAADPHSAVNDVFKPKSFGDVGLALENVENWLESSAWTLHQMTKSIDQKASGFSGSAADAFVTAVDNLHKRLGQLYTDMGGNLKTSDGSAQDPVESPVLAAPTPYGQEKMWSGKVKSVAPEQQKFAKAMNEAFLAYKNIAWQGSGNYNPGRLLDVLKQILLNGPADMHAVPISITGEANFDVINGTYDLSSDAGWLTLDTGLKRIWTDQLNEFDKKMRLALKALKDVLDPITSVLDVFHNVAASRLPQSSANDETGSGNTNIPKIDTSDLSNIGTGSAGIGDLSGGSGTDGLGSGSEIGDLSGADSKIDGDSGLGDLDSGSGLDDLGSGSELGDLGSGSALGDLGTDIGGLNSSGSALGDLGTDGSALGDLSSVGLDDLGSGSALGALPVLSGLGLGSGLTGGGSGIGGSSLGSGLGSLGSLGSNSSPSSKLGGSAIGPLAAEALKGAGFDGTGLDESGLTGSSLGAGLNGSGSGSGSLGTGLDGSTAATGSAGMPFMPPMGGMGGGAGGENKERERSIWLEEDEDVWGTDPNLMPAVLGRGELPALPPAQPLPAGIPGGREPGQGGSQNQPVKPFKKVRENDGRSTAK